jgi:hypothetical protein
VDTLAWEVVDRHVKYGGEISRLWSDYMALLAGYCANLEPRILWPLKNLVAMQSKESLSRVIASLERKILAGAETP